MKICQWANKSTNPISNSKNVRIIYKISRRLSLKSLMRLKRGARTRDKKSVKKSNRWIKVGTKDLCLLKLRVKPLSRKIMKNPHKRTLHHLNVKNLKKNWELKLKKRGLMNHKVGASLLLQKLKSRKIWQPLKGSRRIVTKNFKCQRKLLLELRLTNLYAISLFQFNLIRALHKS